MKQFNPTANLVSGLALLAASLLCSTSYAATADGEPSYNPRRDAGLYVWRTDGTRWHVRLLAGGAPQQFDGAFEATKSFASVSLVKMEAADDASLISPNVLNVSYESWPRGEDGTDFSLPTGAGLCLRDTGGQGAVALLGRNAVPVTLPADLTGSGACDDSPTAGDGLFISRTAGGDWQVRLVSKSEPQAFSGVFETAQGFQRVQRVSLESGDNATLSGSGALNTNFNTWPGGFDGVDFAAANQADVCLRDTGGPGVQVYLGTGAAAVPVTAPISLSGQACGAASAPLPDPLPPAPAPAPSGSRKYNAGHYISLMRGNDGQTVMADSIQPGVMGFKKRYTWRELEPSLGQYDFSEIASDLAFASSQGMHLIVMIEDKTFKNEKPTPVYLQGTEYTRANRADGYTLVRWSPYVVTRMKALVQAIGQRFDANAYFEGIALQESAPGFDGATLNATGYTPEKYRDALIAVLSHAATSMPKSRVFWFMNFFPGKQDYIGDIASAVASKGVIMGGPDVAPDNWALVNRTYPFYHEFAGKMPLFGQVEPMVYSHLHADTSYPTKYWTMAELFKYGRDTLKIDYMFWVRLPKASPSDSYDYFDALPVISNNLGFNSR
ncbi:hypothetical protein BH24PSE2_BH24PSE2_12620 [soil metagenome]